MWPDPDRPPMLVAEAAVDVALVCRCWIFRNMVRELTDGVWSRIDTEQRAGGGKRCLYRTFVERSVVAIKELCGNKWPVAQFRRGFRCLT
jgi:hypothetical protein